MKIIIQDCVGVLEELKSWKPVQIELDVDNNDTIKEIYAKLRYMELNRTGFTHPWNGIFKWRRHEYHQLIMSYGEIIFNEDIKLQDFNEKFILQYKFNPQFKGKLLDIKLRIQV
jgi:hypothetical protein